MDGNGNRGVGEVERQWEVEGNERRWREMGGGGGRWREVEAGGEARKPL